jgi:MoxR-like ATPase
MNDKRTRFLRDCDAILLGKSLQIRLALACILARGHLLIEDIPGVGKTTLVKLLAKGAGFECRRIQFTSDLLPADILGGSVYDARTGQFVFHKGPIFSHFVLADELNRASPKTQSALLQAMEERVVSLDEISHPLPKPFFVFATQNSHEYAGTFPLPESQLDRFLMRVSLGYPDADSERRLILSGEDRAGLIERMPPAFAPGEIERLQEEVARVHVSEPIADYVARILAESRVRASSGIGLSPRAGLALKSAAQAWAYLAGRDMVLPEDVQAIAVAVIAHRLNAGDAGAVDGEETAVELVRSVHVD